MIRNALENEKSAIYRIWKEMFSFDDQGYTDYYFAELYRAKDTLVYVKNTMDYMNINLAIAGNVVFCFNQNNFVVYGHVFLTVKEKRYSTF